jgi:signal transduction histidine kinase
MEPEFVFQNEKKYRGVFCNSPQPMLIYNTKTHYIIEANNMASNLYGYTTEEFLQIKITSILDNPPHLTGTPGSTEQLQMHKDKNNEHILINVKGTQIPFPENAYLILCDRVKEQALGEPGIDDNGTLSVKPGSNYSDFARLKWLAENFLERNKRFLNIIDINGINDLLNKALFSLVPVLNNNEISSLEDDLKNNGTDITPAFSEWVELCEAPLKDSLLTLLKIAAYIKSIILYRSTVADLTLSGRSLRKGNVSARIARIDSLNHSLVEKIAKQTKSLNRLKRKIKYERGLNNFSAELISSSSHHFRTPLAIIYSSAEILELKQNYLDSNIAIKHINLIKKEVTDLTSFLDDILTVAQTNFFEAGPDLFRLNIEKFCNNFIEDTGPVLNNHQVICNIYLKNNIIISNSRYLKTIFENLISNAVKYSPPGNILIDIIEDKKDIKILFTDNGIGIPPENIDDIFKPFFRGSNAGHIKGSGLGLSIVKKCTVALGGLIHCSSKPGTGTVFTLILPREP